MSPQEYTAGLNSLLGDRSLAVSLTTDDLSFTPQVVTDATKNDPKLSVALARHLSPPIHSGEFYHYTSAADKIVASNRLRLTSVKKRLTESELEPFLREFGFDYPLEIDPATTLPRYAESIASKLFYASFTPTSITQIEEEYFWTEFAGPNGGRLKFSVTLGSGCLRQIVYGSGLQKAAELFREIKTYTQTSIGRIFYWESSAILSGLCLPLKLAHEKELRLITTPESGLPFGHDNDSGFDYLDIKLNEDNPLLIRLDLTEIQTDNPFITQRPAITIPRTI